MSATEVRPYFDRDPLLFGTPKKKKMGISMDNNIYIYIYIHTVLLVVWNIFFHNIMGIIIPTDELILFRGVGLNHQAVSFFRRLAFDWKAAVDSWSSWGPEVLDIFFSGQCFSALRPGRIFEHSTMMTSKPRCEPWCWNMNPNICQKSASFVGKYTSTMEQMG